MDVSIYINTYMKSGFIYGLVCPKTKTIRYIGQTINLNRRLLRHKREARNKVGRLTHKESWLRSLYKDNILNNIKMIVIEECTLNVIDEREIFFIALYRRETDLTNLSDGGKSPVLRGVNHPMFGKRHSKETIKKQSECKLGRKNPMFGKAYKRTSEIKDKISKALKSSKKFKKSRQSAEYKEKMSTITHIDDVLLLDDNFNIVKTLKSCNEAAAFLNCTYANTKNARRDKRKCKGYWIVYNENYENFKYEKNTSVDT